MNGFKLLEKERFIEYNDDIELLFIELPKFSKAEHELQSVQDKWLYFIKNAGKLDYVPKNMEQELKKAFTIANEANLSREELDLQHRKRDFIMIQKASIEQALKQGIQQGITQALQETILNAHRADLAVETIAQIVQMDIAQVQAVLAKIR
ncbi:MAG: Rpn family recombination-promoting nuclease/putative transposase [Methylovulum sp.]|nr:Rpn family recombination-promoting nuclease/putative transposase [Methylovulum sp.]